MSATPAPLRPRAALAGAAPYLAFFLSGASSLIFESLWTRHFHHVFGSTSAAMSTVLSVFMAGLGLGAWVFGKYAERIKRPIVVYAFAELAVAACGVAIPFLVQQDGWLAGVNAWLRASFGAQSMGLALGRFLAAVPVLIVPTTLMGSTLPLLARHFVQQEQRAGAASSHVGVLYALNTLGAVTGTGVGGLVLLPWVGLSTTNYIAASVNLLLGLGILGIMWTSARASPPERAEPEAAAKKDAPAKKGATKDYAKDEAPPVSGALRVWAIVRFVRGGAAIALGVGMLVLGGGARLIGLLPLGLGVFQVVLAARRLFDGTLPEPEVTKHVEPQPIPSIARPLVLIVFGFSGATALCYEVVWTRALANVIGSSFQSFQLILMTFLIGIAGGSALASGLLDGSRRPLTTVSLCSGALALVACAPIGVAKWGGVPPYVFTVLVLWALVVALGWVARTSEQRAVEMDPDAAGRASTTWGFAILGIPVVAAAGLAIGVEGTLSKIVASVVACLAAYLVAILVSRRALVLLVALVQLLIAASTFVNFVWADDIPLTFARLVAPLKDTLPDHVGLVRFFMFLTAGLCTLPATFGMGAMFPLALRLWTQGGKKIAADVGTVYTSNTAGSIVGAWLPGFVLMPAIGMQHTLLIAIAINALMALVMLVASAAEPESEKLTERGDKKTELPMWQAVTVYVLAPLIPALLALGFLGSWSLTAPLAWNRATMTLGVFRVSLAADVLDPEHWGEPDLVFYKDGLSTTVTVERWGRHLALKNNGKVDASNGDDMPTQIMVAGYPLLMHERGPRDLDVAVVGFGSGVTVGTTLQFPVRSVHVIELERAIPEASRWFEPVNHLRYPLDSFPFVQMPRLTVVNDDGRNFLASTHDRFDIIMSEPSNPWITGVSDLFTRDHFAIAKQRLRPGGIYCQWVQLYEMSPEHIKTIFRTFASQFRYVVVFAAEDLSSDTVVLGSDSPLPLDLERVRRTFQLPGVPALMEGAYIHTPFDVFSRVIFASREEVMSYAQVDEERDTNGQMELITTRSNGPDDECRAPECRRRPVPINTDDNAVIEFGAPDDLIGFQRYEGYLENIYAPDWPYGRLLPHLAHFGSGDVAARNYAEQAMSLIASGKKNEAAQLLAASQRAGHARETAVALETLALLMTDEREPRISIEPPVPGPQLDRRQAEELVAGFDAVKRSVDEGAYEAALTAMEEIPTPLRLHSGPALRFLYGYLLYKGAAGQISQYRAAIDNLEDLVRGDEDYVAAHPEVYYFLARSYDQELSFDKALRNMRTYVEARVVPAAGPDDVQEPPVGEAPTTDAPGEAPKDDGGAHHRAG